MGVCCNTENTMRREREKLICGDFLFNLENNKEDHLLPNIIQITNHKCQSPVISVTSLDSTFIEKKHSFDVKNNSKLTFSKVEKVINVAIYGPPNVGKTTFINIIGKRRTKNIFYIPSICTEKITINQYYNNQKYSFIYIVPFNEPNLFPADCYFIFFDVSSLKSFIEAEMFIMKHLTDCSNPIILIGNKVDLGQNVSKENITKLCKKYHCLYLEMSVINHAGLLRLIKLTKEVVLKN